MQSRMLSSPPKSITKRSIPRAMPPCGGAPYLEGLEQEPEPLLGPSPRRSPAGRRPSAAPRIVDSDRAAAGFAAVDDQVVGLGAALRRDRFPAAQVLVTRCRERVVHGDPSVLLLVELEHRELDDPREVHRLRVVELHLVAQCASAARAAPCRSLPTGRPRTAAGRPARHPSARQFGQHRALESSWRSARPACRRPRPGTTPALSRRNPVDVIGQLVDAPARINAACPSWR